MQRPNEDSSNILRDAASGAEAPAKTRSSFSAEVEEAVRGTLSRVAARLDGGSLVDALGDLQALPNASDRIEYAPTYVTLSAGMRRYVSREEFLSDSFLHAARQRHMTPYQYAGVRALEHQGITTFLTGQIRPDGEDGLSIDELGIVGSGTLADLPDHFTVRRNLTLARCAALIHLPKGLVVGRDLMLDGSAALEAVPDDVQIGGALTLIGCGALRRLPRHLRLGRDITMKGCHLLESLPEVLELGMEAEMFKRLLGCPPHLRDQARRHMRAGAITAYTVDEYSPR